MKVEITGTKSELKSLVFDCAYERRVNKCTGCVFSDPSLNCPGIEYLAEFHQIDGDEKEGKSL